MTGIEGESGVFAEGEPVNRAELERYLGAVGEGVRIYRRARIVGAERLFIGDCSQIDDFVFVNCGLGVRIGRHVHVSVHASITGGGRCSLGDHCGIGAGVRLITGTENIHKGYTNPTAPAGQRFPDRGAIEVGAHALVFTNSVVFPGVEIGAGAVVAAGSLVHRSLDPWSVYAGNPLVKVGPRTLEGMNEPSGQSERDRVE